jgi:hypothetical protein
MLRIRIDLDPDPACHFDLDPACHFDPDADPTFLFEAVPYPGLGPSFQIKAQNLESAHFPYILACHLQIDAYPDPAYHMDADSDPACHVDADADMDPTFHFDAVLDPDPDP